MPIGLRGSEQQEKFARLSGSGRDAASDAPSVRLFSTVTGRSRSRERQPGPGRPGCIIRSLMPVIL
eukprot:163113-Hanusia_phi.AAC.1